LDMSMLWWLLWAAVVVWVLSGACVVAIACREFSASRRESRPAHNVSRHPVSGGDAEVETHSWWRLLGSG